MCFPRQFRTPHDSLSPATHSQAVLLAEFLCCGFIFTSWLEFFFYLLSVSLYCVCVCDCNGFFLSYTNCPCCTCSIKKHEFSEAVQSKTTWGSKEMVFWLSHTMKNQNLGYLQWFTLFCIYWYFSSFIVGHQMRHFRIWEMRMRHISVA